MIVNYSKRFIKQAEKLDDKTKKVLAGAIKKAKEAESISDIPNCIKLSGYKQVYRIRVSNHRAIFVQEIDGALFFEYIADRNEIYNRKFKNLLKGK